MTVCPACHSPIRVIELRRHVPTAVREGYVIRTSVLATISVCPVHGLAHGLADGRRALERPVPMAVPAW